MGIPGILKEIGKGERIALTKFAIDHYEKTNRPLRVAIDAAIWNFQNAASQGGKNPALRTMFYRLLKLLALPIHPVFVYDGSKKPLTKRGKTVTRYGTCIENEMAKQLLSLFKFPSHNAPGEAEAECATLQRHGVVDAVMSQDVDAIMFGSGLTLRDWSKEGTRGNKTPTHVNVLDAEEIKERSGLDADGMVLVALLSGGDYDDGVAGFGSSLACEVAKAGFGPDLLRLSNGDDEDGLKEWRQRLEYELETNESGYFRRRHLKLTLPSSFPDRMILKHYVNPNVTDTQELSALATKWSGQWETEIDVKALREYSATMFDWNWKNGARKFMRCLAQPLFQHRLRRGMIQSSLYSPDNITGDRKHFINDGIVELRFHAVPSQVVEIDIEAEEDNPEYIHPNEDGGQLDFEDLEDDEASIKERSGQDLEILSPSKRKSAPWNPHAAEKWWIPATLLKVGLGLIVEEWEQRQRDIIADPKKFATRKCPKVPKLARQIDDQMKHDSIRSFLVTKRPQDKIERPLAITTSPTEVCQTSNSATDETMPKTPSKRRRQVNVEVVSPSITRFFKPRKPPGSTIPTLRKSEKACNEPKKASATQPSRGATANIHEFDSVQYGTEQSQSRLRMEILPHVFVATNEQKVSNEHASGSIGTNIFEKEAKRLSQRTNPNSQMQPKNMKKEMNKGLAAELLPNPALAKELKSDPAGMSCDEFPNHVTISSKVSALPRESLPGTWKQLVVEDFSKQRPIRVSFVDLTGD